jgi:hypothetical protein
MSACSCGFARDTYGGVRSLGCLVVAGGGDAGDDEDGVEDVPAVQDEGPQPMAVGVDCQLDAEEDGEGVVDGIEDSASGRRIPVSVL